MLDVRKECMISTKSENASIDMCFIDFNYVSEFEMILRNYGDFHWRHIIVSGEYEEKIIGKIIIYFIHCRLSKNLCYAVAQQGFFDSLHYLYRDNH